jgi:hypothetical protein
LTEPTISDYSKNKKNKNKHKDKTRLKYSTCNREDLSGFVVPAATHRA